MEPKQRIQLLIVEDNVEHANLIGAALRRSVRQHYDETHVRSAAAGVEQLENAEFDVILLDLSLPDSPPEQTL
ncbi:MAG: hypothetical protein WA771_02435, partial [Chthoniobacterales bacterium]